PYRSGLVDFAGIDVEEVLIGRIAGARDVCGVDGVERIRCGHRAILPRLKRRPHQLPFPPERLCSLHPMASSITSTIPGIVPSPGDPTSTHAIAAPTIVQARIARPTSVNPGTRTSIPPTISMFP